MRRDYSSQLGLGRASWNRRMQTGGPSPTPVQQAPCSPITRRTGRCPDRLQTKVTGSHPQEPLPLRQSVSPADVPHNERNSVYITYNRIIVKAIENRYRSNIFARTWL